MFDDLLGDEFASRPENDELAFLYYERIFCGQLDAAVAGLEDRDARYSRETYNHFRQTYLNHVIAVVKALNLDILEEWVSDSAAASNSTNFDQIKFDIDAAVTGIKVRHAQIIRQNSVGLTPDTREKIRDLITKIKLTIESIDLPLPRKEALMTKLNAFAAEVDRDRTRLEAFGALMLEVTGGVAKVERKLRPIRKWLDSIANLLHQARADEDAYHRLLAPNKRLAAPAKQIAPPPPPKEAIPDDDIPF